jgi:hypothetical protein
MEVLPVVRFVGEIRLNGSAPVAAPAAMMMLPLLLSGGRTGKYAFG